MAPRKFRLLGAAMAALLLIPAALDAAPAEAQRFERGERGDRDAQPDRGPRREAARRGDRGARPDRGPRRASSDRGPRREAANRGGRTEPRHVRPQPDRRDVMRDPGNNPRDHLRDQPRPRRDFRSDRPVRRPVQDSAPTRAPRPAVIRETNRGGSIRDRHDRRDDVRDRRDRRDGRWDRDRRSGRDNRFDRDRRDRHGRWDRDRRDGRWDRDRRDRRWDRDRRDRRWDRRPGRHPGAHHDRRRWEYAQRRRDFYRDRARRQAQLRWLRHMNHGWSSSRYYGHWGPSSRWRYHRTYYNHGYDRRRFAYYDGLCRYEGNGDAAIVGALLGALIGGAAAGDDSVGAGILVGAGFGAVLGSSLNRIDSCDRAQYHYAMNYAFEYGQPYYWGNPYSGVRGAVVIRETYYVGGRECRWGDAEIYMPDGTYNYDRVRMCRDAYGDWQVAHRQ
ncbi:hypothetical protein [Maricaulis sp.]|uniref:hypothetical protein n=1 Tax=Maricaulis sp. TaxID=1486257 RepID=UPI00261AFC6F|nr:hypothetical protein [Maricaulis sp.]